MEPIHAESADVSFNEPIVLHSKDTFQLREVSMERARSDPLEAQEDLNDAF